MTLKQLADITILWDKKKSLEYAKMVGRFRRDGIEMETAMHKAYEVMTMVKKDES
jgi:hypothetical protein